MSELIVDNPAPAEGELDPQVTPEVQPEVKADQGFNWKNALGEDLKAAVGMEKFTDDEKGIQNLGKSYQELSKLLGNDKIPVPKGPDDEAAWKAVNKALGVPESADKYGLQDAEVPDDLKNLAFDKSGFADIALKHNLNPQQAKGLWEEYTGLMKGKYSDVMREHEEKIGEVSKELRSEWGSAYDARVELGQKVINQFADDQETQDLITARMTDDPRLVKFMAKLGEQFSENKIGDFGKQKGFSMTPEDAKQEIEAIRANPHHPYWGEKDSNGIPISESMRKAAIGRFESLLMIANSGGQG